MKATSLMKATSKIEALDAMLKPLVFYSFAPLGNELCSHDDRERLARGPQQFGFQAPK
jgi:hypothetical protein